MAGSGHVRDGRIARCAGPSGAGRDHFPWIGDSGAVADVALAHLGHRHVSNIRTKLGVPSRAAAAAWEAQHHEL